MEAWKKAVVLGAIGSAALLFMRKRYPAGVLATGVGLAVLAAEYPEKFEKVRESLPEYFEHGLRVMEMAGQAGKADFTGCCRGRGGVLGENGGLAARDVHSANKAFNREGRREKAAEIAKKSLKKFLLQLLDA
jgi:hypothetical protein